MFVAAAVPQYCARVCAEPQAEVTCEGQVSVQHAEHGAHSDGLPQPCQLSSPARAHTTYSPTLSHCQPTHPPLLSSCWGEA